MREIIGRFEQAEARASRERKRGRQQPPRQRKENTGGNGHQLVKVELGSPPYKRVEDMLETEAGKKALGAKGGGGHRESNKKQLLSALRNGTLVPKKIMRGFPQRMQQEIKAIQRGAWCKDWHSNHIQSS